MRTIWQRAAASKRAYVNNGQQSGQSLVEFALTLPLFLLLTAGLLDVGLAFYQYNDIAHAAREGARFAAVDGGSQNPSFDWGNPTTEPYNGNWPNTYDTSTGYPVSGYVGTHTIVGTVAGSLPGFNLNDVQVTITASSGSPVSTYPIRVSIDYAFRPTTLLFLGGHPITLTASSQMIIE